MNQSIDRNHRPTVGQIVIIEDRPAKLMSICDRCEKLSTDYMTAELLTKRTIFYPNQYSPDELENWEFELLDIIDKLAGLEDEECNCVVQYISPLSNRGVTNAA